ncbi:MAG: hypothetical protein J7605_12750, partial [Variovorax sp.]|nr:hypothetical protein [Variovorax sp.]
MDSNLNVIPAQYTAMAAQLSKDAGIAYRYGPDAISSGTANAGPALYKRADTMLGSPAPSYSLWWQMGQPSSNMGSYSSDQGSITFVADDTKQR